jgi:hypothetical protein
VVTASLIHTLTRPMRRTSCEPRAIARSLATSRSRMPDPSASSARTVAIHTRPTLPASKPLPPAPTVNQPAVSAGASADCDGMDGADQMRALGSKNSASGSAMLANTLTASAAQTR